MILKRVASVIFSFPAGKNKVLAIFLDWLESGIKTPVLLKSSVFVKENSESLHTAAEKKEGCWTLVHSSGFVGVGRDESVTLTLFSNDLKESAILPLLEIDCEASCLLKSLEIGIDET